MEVKKNPKLVIGRNSSIYFAIGLNLMLLLSWQALEYRSYEKKELALGVVKISQPVLEDVPIVQMKATPPPPPPPPAAVPETIEVVEDDVLDVQESVIESTETGQDDAINESSDEPIGVSDVQVVGAEEDVEVAFIIIEEAPVFPGCEGLNKRKTIACFQKKINQHIKTNFKYPESTIEEGLVSVVFVIDTNGKTTNIRTRGPDKILENEAQRIISLLPKMKPGKQRGRPVKVVYSVPIYFQVD